MISLPLFDMLKKHVFVWTVEHKKAFQLLKQALITAPVLALPDFTQPFCIYTDACQYGVGAVLMQQGHPLAFLGRALGPKNQGLSTYEKEYMAIILATVQWRSYLQLAEFVVYTDHHSLSQLNEQRLHTLWQKKVYTKLAGLQYKIIYKKGIENGAADALSRQPMTSTCLVVSHCIPDCLHEMVQGYQNNAAAQQLLTRLSLQSSEMAPFTLHQGVIRHKGRVWLAGNVQLQQKVIQVMHDAAVGGHSRAPATYSKLKQLFFWPGMKTAISEYKQLFLK